MAPPPVSLSEPEATSSAAPAWCWSEALTMAVPLPARTSVPPFSSTPAVTPAPSVSVPRLTSFAPPLMTSGSPLMEPVPVRRRVRPTMFLTKPDAGSVSAPATLSAEAPESVPSSR